MRSHDPRNQIKIRSHEAPRAPRLSPSRRGYGHEWQKLRKMVLARSPLCVRCNQPATDVDHIVAKSHGGTDELTNLQTLCHKCHAKKTFFEDRVGGGFVRLDARERKLNPSRGRQKGG